MIVQKKHSRGEIPPSLYSRIRSRAIKSTRAQGVTPRQRHRRKLTVVNRSKKALQKYGQARVKHRMLEKKKNPEQQQQHACHPHTAGWGWLGGDGFPPINLGPGTSCFFLKAFVSFQTQGAGNLPLIPSLTFMVETPHGVCPAGRSLRVLQADFLEAFLLFSGLEPIEIQHVTRNDG